MRRLLLILIALAARPFVRPSGGPVRRVLYIKPDHLGDLLLATPVLTALRQTLPEAQITALVGPWAAFVLERNPDVDAVVTLAFPGFERAAKRDALAPYALLLRESRRLRRESYDLAIIGRDDHWWGAALALLAGIPQRIGYATPECRPLLTAALPHDPREHVTVQGMALVGALAGPTTDHRRPTTGVRKGEAFAQTEDGPSPEIGAANASPLRSAVGGRWSQDSVPQQNPAVAHASPLRSVVGGRPSYPMRFTPSAADETWAADWVTAGLSGARFAVIHPGTGGPDKHWLAGRWAQVADRLAAQGYRLVLTGGPAEAALVAEVAGLCAAPPLTLAGQTSVGQLAALLRRAELVLGVDSGPLHLAAAVGARTVHLFGPSDHIRFGPWGEPARHTVLRAGIACSPCGVFAACPRGLAQPECMERIGVADVLAATGQ